MHTAIHQHSAAEQDTAPDSMLTVNRHASILLHTLVYALRTLH